MEASIGITPQRIVDTMAVLNRSSQYIDSQVTKFIKQHVRFWNEAGASVSLTVLGQQHEEIVYRVLAALIKQIGQSDYTARADDVERLADVVLSEKFKGSTLGHCEIFVQAGKLWIVPELKLKTKMPQKIWQNFIEENPQYAKQNLPYKLRVALVKTKMKVEF